MKKKGFPLPACRERGGMEEVVWRKSAQGYSKKNDSKKITAQNFWGSGPQKGVDLELPGFREDDWQSNRERREQGIHTERESSHARGVYGEGKRQCRLGKLDMR